MTVFPEIERTVSFGSFTFGITSSFIYKSMTIIHTQVVRVIARIVAVVVIIVAVVVVYHRLVVTHGVMPQVLGGRMR